MNELMNALRGSNKVPTSSSRMDVGVAEKQIM
jgi:hypothetical protein